MSICLRLQRLSDRMDMAGVFDEPLPISRAEVLPFLREMPQPMVQTSPVESIAKMAMIGACVLSYRGRKVQIL